MSLRFHPLKVARIVRETTNANTIYFEKPADKSFDFKPGQYLTLKVQVGEESLRRAYSLCSSPVTDSQLAVTVKRVEGGRVSNHLPDTLKAGDTLEVYPPMGNFAVDLQKKKKHHYVLIGGGSGITPLMSIMKSVLEVERKAKVTLIYANRDIDNIIFKAVLEEMEAKYGDRIRVIHSLDNPGEGWTGLSGRLSRQSLLGLFQDIVRSDKLAKSYWVCGPQGMMEEAEAALSFMGVSKKDVHRESFAAALPDTSEPKKGSTVKKAGTYEITVKLDGSEQVIKVSPQETILDAVIDAGMDPPYACQMGVCCTCRAKVLSGSVEMEEDEGLSDAEIEEGYVLTCQSHPLTPDVVVEYG